VLIVKRSVGRAEVHQIFFQLLNTSLATNRLIVDLDARMAALEITDPARHDGVNEGATSTH